MLLLLQIVIAIGVLYNPAIVAIKMSILLLYRRIFTARYASFNRSIWCIGGFVLSYSIIQIVLTIFHCNPVDALWDPTVKAKCINFHTVGIVFSSLNIGTDILILCLPVPELWKLNMPRRRKYELMGMFFLGGLFVFPSLIGGGSLTVLSVCVASIIRVPYIAQLSLLDPSWSDVYGAIWSIVELSLGIVSACLPTLGPLFLHFFHGGYSSTPPRQPAKRRPTGKAEDGLSDTIPMVEIEAAFRA